MDRAVANNSEKTASTRNKRPKSFWISGGYFDYKSFFLIMVLVMFGIMMVYSASSFRAVTNGLSSYYYAIKQAIFAAAGTVAMIIVSHVNYRKYKHFTKLLMATAIVLSAYVIVKGISSHGASRWISIAGQQFQPSEICKPILILYMAHVCVSDSEKLTNIWGTIKLAAWPMLCILLIGKENLSTAIVCFAIVVAILFVASPKLINLFILGGIGVVCAIIGIFAAGYRGDRFEAWLNPETSENGFQTMQSLYAIGSGGLFGRGLGQSIQKQGFLPESHNDMIFSVICEELGLFGAFAVIALFIMLLLAFKNIANNSPDSYGGFIMTGIMTHIAVQTLVNIGVVTNTIPNTGVTLPFISYGGTSLIFLMIEMGVVLGISRQANPIK